MAITTILKIPTPPPTPARSIWQRHTDRESEHGSTASSYNQGADVFINAPSPTGAGSPKAGYRLVAELVHALDKAAGVKR